MKPVVAVVGSSAHGSKWCPEIEAAAREIGRMAGELGAAVLTGGLTGVMASALEGAKEAGAVTVGILRTLDRRTANPFVDVALPTDLGIARNVLTASGCSCMVALPGGTGTLEEILFAVDYERPVLAVDCGPIRMQWPAHPLITRVACPRPDVLRWDQSMVRHWMLQQLKPSQETQPHGC